MTQEKTSGKNVLAMLLCGAPMLAGAGFLFYMLTGAMLERISVENWIAAPAEIQSASLKTSRSSRARVGHHRGSVYNLDLSYTYSVNGQVYHGNRLNLLTLSENFTSYFTTITRMLGEYKRNGEAIQCWVNPSIPSESILFRDGPVYQVGILTCFLLMCFMLGFGAFCGVVCYAVERFFDRQSTIAKANRLLLGSVFTLGLLYCAVPITYFAWMARQIKGTVTIICHLKGDRPLYSVT